MKLLKKTTALIVCTGILASCLLITPTSADKITNATIEAYEQQLAENAKKQEQYKQELEKLKSEKADAFAEKAAIDKAIEATSVQKVLIESMITELNDDIKRLDEEESRLKSEMESRKQIFLKRMAAMQDEGNVSYVELILSAGDITDFLTRLDYVNAMLEYDKQVMKDLEETQELLKVTREEKNASLEKQNAALEELKAEQANYEVLREVQLQNIAKIDADEDYKQSLLDEAAKMEAEFDNKIQAEIAEIIRQQQLANKNEDPDNNDPSTPSHPAIGSGAFIRPLAPGTGYISSHFGYRNLYGKDYHAATDIAAATGTPIYASAGGTIIRSEWHDSYGNYVLIDHGMNEKGEHISTLYAHMSARFAVAGRTVNQGDIIGQVGNTGYSYGSHLHFEYRINGVRCDPELYVPLG